MNKFCIQLSYLLGSLLISSCATSYKSISPHRVPFTNHLKTNDFNLSYRYNILSEYGNKRYARREMKKGVHIVAVKILNRTSQEVQIGRTAFLFMNDSRLGLLDPEYVGKTLKQPVLIYALYLYFTPIPGAAYAYDDAVVTAGYIMGPGFAFSNMFIAMRGNKRFKNELNEFNIINKVIKPGEEVYGLIGIVYTGYDPISIRRED